MTPQPKDKSPKAPHGRLRATLVAALAVGFVSAAVGFVAFLAQLRGTESFVAYTTARYSE